MDYSLLYALSLFALLTDKDKDEIMSLMLSFPSLQEDASVQTD